MANTTEPTERQERFAVAFVENGGNAAKAARTAGYAVNSARVMGSRLLSNSRVQSLIRDEQFKTVNGPLTSAALSVLRVALDPANDVPWGARIDAAKTVLDRSGIVIAEQPARNRIPGVTVDLAALAPLMARAAELYRQRQAVLDVKPAA